MIPFWNNTLKALLRLFTYEVKFIKSFKNRITKGLIPGVWGGGKYGLKIGERWVKVRILQKC